MKKFIISVYAVGLITLVFLHNPFSGYTTSTTQEIKKISYYPTSPTFTIEKCKQMGHEQEAFESKKLFLGYDKAKLTSEIMSESDAEIKSKLSQDLQLKNNELDTNQKKLSISTYYFNKDCKKFLDSEIHYTAIPFSQWKTINPVMRKFESPSQILYWTLYLTIISVLFVFIFRRKQARST